jgi:hypothetical protein
MDRPRYLVRIAPSPDHRLITWEGVEWAEKYLNEAKA